MLSTDLFAPITSSKTDLLREVEKPLLANQFNTGNSDVLLMLTDSYLVLCENVFNKVPTHYLKLTFSVKFEALFHTYNAMRVLIYFISCRSNPSLTSPVPSRSRSKDNNARRK